MIPRNRTRPVQRRLSLRAGLVALFLALPPALTVAQNARTDTSYTALATQLGAALPTGANVAVTQVEGKFLGNNQPSTTTFGTATFTGKTFTFRSPLTGISSHAFSVGNNFYGNTLSLATGISTIDSYDADDWAVSILKMGQLGVVPDATLNSSRVANHSYVGNGTVKDINGNDVFSISASLDALERIDYLVDRDDLINVVGMNNGVNGTSVSSNGTLIGSNGATLYSYAANTISVGLSSLAHVNGTPISLGDDTVYGRNGSNSSSLNYREHPRPDLVAPEGSTSFGTAIVSSAAGLLVDASRAHGPTSPNPWSTIAYDVRYETSPGIKYQVYAGDTSEVIRAALMAGADRKFFNTDGAKALDYRATAALQSPNGLDRRYGAGQLNVRNSYDVLAGKQHSVDGVTNTVTILPTDSASGFDYDPAFGGASGSNSIARYNFTGAWTGQNLSASLVWNVGIDTDNFASFDPSPALYNLNLRLLDITVPGSPVEISSSMSPFENTENIVATLTAGRIYQLEVTSPDAGTFVWDYGIAWNGSSNQVWLGTSNTWNVNSATNWQRGNNTATTFLDNDQVVFTDLATNKNVNITAPVSPDFVTVNSTANYTFSGSAITGPGGLFQQGTGTLILNNANTYTGGTYISAGRLVVNGSVTGPVEVQSAGTLGGNGTINGNVTGDGTVAPGNSIGTLHIAGAYNITGTNDFEISKVGATLTNDLVDQITGMTYGGVLKISLATGSDAATTFVPGSSWDLFNFTNTFSGQFSNNSDFGILGGGGNLPLLAPQYFWSFDYGAGTLSVIPEPSTWLLASLGTLAAAWGIRKRRVNAAV